MFDALLKHPISFVFCVCLLLFLTAGIFFNAYINDFEFVYLILTVCFALFSQQNIQRLYIFIFALFGFIIYLVFNLECSFILLLECIILGLFMYLNREKENIYIFGIISGAFLLHLYYIQNTIIDVRQHDLTGIFMYMNHITQNGINWWRFNPWYMYYFFHQPLHFIIMGYVLKFENLLWTSHMLAAEGLQYISLFYMTAASIIVYGILKELQFSIKSLLAALILFAFNPTFILMSGYISDDAPTVFWSLFIIYLLLLWHKTKLTKFIIFAALGMGCGVLTKLSILMLVPAISFLFAYELYYSPNKKNAIQQICYFICIAVPLALMWVIRNHIFYDMPFYNIPDTSPAGQNFMYMTLWERIGDFSMIGIPFLNVPKVNDANILLALIKTELFGEWDFSLTNSIAYYPAFALYILNIVLKFIIFIYALLVIKKNIFGIKNPIQVFFVLIYFTIWGYALKYALEFPYACSSDFRLFAQLSLIDVVFLAYFTDLYKKNTAFFVYSTIYAVLVCSVYIWEI